MEIKEKFIILNLFGLIKMSKSYSVLFKNDAIRKFDQLRSYRGVAKYYNIERNLIRSWMRNRELILNASQISSSAAIK